MEGELVMLRQLIGQLQDLLHNSSYHSSSSSLFPPPPFYVLHHSDYQNAWCLPCVEESSADDCCDIVMAPGKRSGKRSGIMKMLETINPPVKRSRKERNQGKSSTAEEGGDVSVNMDQEIWQEFPEELFEAVVSRLPIATIFQFRTVCRTWNSLIDSQSFSQCCAELPQTIPWFYTMTHEIANTGLVYDPSLKKWHHPIIASLPKKSVVLPMASAGGLVCFLDAGHRNFYVANPLTQSFRELPARSFKVWSRVAVGMTLNGSSTSHGYKVVWVGYEGEYEIFDSLKNVWTKRGTLPSNIKLPLMLNFKSQPVAIGSTLYFMLVEPEGIVSYDMVSGTWKQSIIPAPPHLNDHTLAGCGERVMLVGLLTKNAATCVCIWELQKMTLLWKEVDRMPNIWSLEFYGTHTRMNCLGNNGCLILLSLRSRLVNLLITYNVITREWTEVPSCITPGGRKRLWITYGTAFHPSPTAKA